MRAVGLALIFGLLLPTTGAFAKSCVLTLHLEYIPGYRGGWGGGWSALYCDGKEMGLVDPAPRIENEPSLAAALSRELSFAESKYGVKLVSNCSRSERSSTAGDIEGYNHVFVDYMCNLAD